ncbi:hypothetical protein [Bacillus alveayuensis]|uniref:hypothetical protein n=1 Tax=Aeribacillus alveayuensis TaxID=279215 RepID=UPI0005CC9130|nr:hypothetical protein [Bacillus alveayuensis]
MENNSKRYEEAKKLVQSMSDDDMNIQAVPICDKHPSCCYEKGCPGLYKLLPNGFLSWTGQCCY